MTKARNKGGAGGELVVQFVRFPRRAGLGILKMSRLPKDVLFP